MDNKPINWKNDDNAKNPWRESNGTTKNIGLNSDAQAAATNISMNKNTQTDSDEANVTTVFPEKSIISDEQRIPVIQEGGQTDQTYGTISNSTKILVICLALLSLAIAAGGAIILLNRNNDSNSSYSAENIGDGDDSSEESMNSETTISEKDDSTGSDAAENGAVVTETVQRSSSADTKESAKAAMREHMSHAGEQGNIDYNPKYAFFDVDSDGTDELFITYKTEADQAVKLYVYLNGVYICKKENILVQSARYSPEEKLIRQDLYGGGHGIKLFTLTDGVLTLKEECGSNASEGKFTVNGSEVSESLYNDTEKKFDEINWISIPDSSAHFSDFIDISEYQPAQTEKPSPSPSPVYQSSGYTWTGYVDAGTDGLYVRSSPEIADGNKLGCFATGTALTIYSDKCTGNWYYASGTATSGQYVYGYVYSDYVSSRAVYADYNSKRVLYARVEAGTAGLYVRSSPEINDSNKLDCFETGTILSVYPGNAPGNWYYASGKGMSGKYLYGYVYGDYLEFQ